MRVLALGGASSVGKVAVRRLVAHPAVESIVIADREIDRAYALAEAVRAPAGSRGAHTAVWSCRVDTSDAVALETLMAGVDVVANIDGHDDRVGVGVLDAAITVGAHYVDVCDDPRRTTEMLARDSRAKAAGLLAIVGMGASPGVTNLLACTAADHLDRVDDIVTGWPEDPRQDTDPVGRVSPATVHWVHQCARPSTILRDGVLSEAAPLGPVDLDYPELGSGRVFAVGHPEPVTLPRAYPELRSSTSVAVITPALHRILVEVSDLVDRGVTTAAAAAALARRIATADLDADGPRAPFGWLFAIATGSVEGAATTVAAGLSATPPGGTAGITGLSLALAVEMLADGRLTARGAHPPETSVPPMDFLELLAPLCEGAPGIDDVVRITRSVS